MALRTRSPFQHAAAMPSYLGLAFVITQNGANVCAVLIEYTIISRLAVSDSFIPGTSVC